MHHKGYLSQFIRSHCRLDSGSKSNFKNGGRSNRKYEHGEKKSKPDRGQCYRSFSAPNQCNYECDKETAKAYQIQKGGDNLCRESGNRQGHPLPPTDIRYRVERDHRDPYDCTQTLAKSSHIFRHNVVPENFGA